jgi:hypothetical protein
MPSDLVAYRRIKQFNAAWFQVAQRLTTRAVSILIRIAAVVALLFFTVLMPYRIHAHRSHDINSAAAPINFA